MHLHAVKQDTSRISFAILVISIFFVTGSLKESKAEPINYDETISGDLDGSQHLTFGVGLNKISGNSELGLTDSLGNFISTHDSFFFTLPKELEITFAELTISNIIIDSGVVDIDTVLQLSSLSDVFVAIFQIDTDLFDATSPLVIDFPSNIFPLSSNTYLQAIQTPGGFSHPGPNSAAATYSYELSYNVGLAASAIGLVSYWSFDDGTANDQIGNNDGIIVGGTTFTGGGDDAAPTPDNVDALRFNGVDSEVSVPDDVSLDFASSDDVTLSMWFKRESENRGEYHILGKRVFCSSMNYQLARDAGLLHFDSTLGGRVNAGVDASIDTWVHIASTYDGWTQTARLYVDGVLERTVVPYTLGPIVNGDLKIGNTGGCPNSARFQGVIDEVRIYNRVLEADEIAALALSSDQDILVEPVAHDFGQVAAFTSKDAIITISNTGGAALEVTDVMITSGAANFSVTGIEPPVVPPFTVSPGDDVFLTVTMFPTSDGAFMGTLAVESDDPDETIVEVSLVGNGLVGAGEDQATVLEAAVDDTIAAGDLVGSGTENSSEGRLGAFADMIEAAGDLIEAGFIDDACGQLRSALRRIDGNPRPPDFVEGDDAALIADQIEFLRDSLGCDG